MLKNTQKIHSKSNVLFISWTLSLRLLQFIIYRVTKIDHNRAVRSPRACTPAVTETFMDHSKSLGQHRLDWVAFIGIAALLCCLQLKRLSAAVSFGGGRSQLLEEGSLPRQLLECPQSCVIDLTTASSQALLPPSTTEWAKSVKNIVQRSAQ